VPILKYSAYRLGELTKGQCHCEESRRAGRRSNPIEHSEFHLKHTLHTGEYLGKRQVLTDD
jgi:hypothetical protein